ncbi:hypothetical protein BCR32DRAFT_244438 [Anaeromyces robustus]|uniref:SH3 domain-containing protein n=1 Tax=Anaeromyces robustus TaxID=1754192 RepID=A0A1Y1X8H6_9FUNG|nr:hypothetical protein BCR32DRAFT_244438 [Anaeromyces robustus]|eukprot:ORX82049.1 hypothetical protein BCR32DRAFT_244438 [Anaeromyces robustus]
MSSFNQQSNNSMENDFTINKPKINNSSFNTNNNKNGSNKTPSTSDLRPIKTSNSSFKKNSSNSLNSPSTKRSNYNNNNYKRNNNNNSGNRSGGSSLETISNSNSNLNNGNSKKKNRSNNNSYSKKHNPFNNNGNYINTKFNSPSTSSSAAGTPTTPNTYNKPYVTFSSENYNNNGNNYNHFSNNSNDSSNTSTSYNKRNSLHSMVLKIKRNTPYNKYTSAPSSPVKKNNNISFYQAQYNNNILNSNNDNRKEGGEINNNSRKSGSNPKLSHSNSFVLKAKKQYESLSNNSLMNNDFKSNSNSTLYSNKNGKQKDTGFTMPKKLNDSNNNRTSYNSSYLTSKSSTPSTPSTPFSAVSINKSTSYLYDKDNNNKNDINDKKLCNKHISINIPVHSSPATPITTEKSVTTSTNLSIDTSKKSIENKMENNSDKYSDKESLTSPPRSLSKSSIILDESTLSSPISATTEPTLQRNPSDILKKENNDSSSYNKMFRNGYNTIDRRAIAKLKTEWEVRFNTDQNGNKDKEECKKKRVFSEIDHTTTQNTRNEWIRKVSMQCNSVPFPRGSVASLKSKGLTSSSNSNSSSCENLFDSRIYSVDSYITNNSNNTSNQKLHSSKLYASITSCNEIYNEPKPINENSIIDTETGFKPSMIKNMKHEYDVSSTYSETFNTNRSNFEMKNFSYFQKSDNIKHSTSYVFNENDRINDSKINMAKRRSLNFTDYSSSNSNNYYNVSIKNKKSYKIAQLMQFFENDKALQEYKKKYLTEDDEISYITNENKNNDEELQLKNITGSILEEALSVASINPDVKNEIKKEEEEEEDLEKEEELKEKYKNNENEYQSIVNEEEQYVQIEEEENEIEAIKTEVSNNSIKDLLSKERQQLDFSLKSHSCNKLNEILEKKDDSAQTEMKKNLKSTHSLPNINKELIHEIFNSLLMSERKRTTSVKIQRGDSNSIDINMMSIGANGKHKKFLTGYSSNIKNTGMSYDIKKTNIVKKSSCSQIDIMSSNSNNYNTLKGLLSNQRKKIYEKLFESEATVDESKLGPVQFTVVASIAHTNHNHKIKQALKFKENDVIDVYIEKDDKYYGKCNGQSGWFPKNCVSSKLEKIINETSCENINGENSNDSHVNNENEQQNENDENNKTNEN